MDCVTELSQLFMDTMSGSNEPLGTCISQSLQDSHGHSRFDRVPKLSEIDIIA